MYILSEIAEEIGLPRGSELRKVTRGLRVLVTDPVDKVVPDRRRRASDHPSAVRHHSLLSSVSPAVILTTTTCQRSRVVVDLLPPRGHSNLRFAHTPLVTAGATEFVELWPTSSLRSKSGTRSTGGGRDRSRRRQLDRAGYIDKGVREGAGLATGGSRRRTPARLLHRPTVFADVDNDSTIAAMSFGPVSA
jgi:hypothetical protein